MTINANTSPAVLAGIEQNYPVLHIAVTWNGNNDDWQGTAHALHEHAEAAEHDALLRAAENDDWDVVDEEGDAVHPRDASQDQLEYAALEAGLEHSVLTVPVPVLPLWFVDAYEDDESVARTVQAETAQNALDMAIGCYANIDFALGHNGKLDSSPTKIGKWIDDLGLHGLCRAEEVSVWRIPIVFGSSSAIIGWNHCTEILADAAYVRAALTRQGLI